MRSARRRPAAGLLLTAAVTAGCAVTASPPAASVAVPESWRGVGETTTVAVAEAHRDLSRWWEELGDRTLSDLVEQALVANPDLRRARASLREARARRSLEGKDHLPDLTATVAGSSTRARSQSVANLYSVGFDASWEPDIFGDTRSAVGAAQAEMEATQASLLATQVSLVAEVALNYVDLRASQGRLAIAWDNLARQGETQQLTEWRAQAGLTSELDVEQSRAQVEETRAQIPTLETSVAEAEHRLAILVGQPPAALHAGLAEATPLPAVPESVVASIPADTLRQRPDVRAAERRLVAASWRVSEAEAARYPTLGISGSLAADGVALGDVVSLDGLLGTLVGRLTAPLFDRRRIGLQIEIQSAVEEQALVDYESTILTALEDVENALVSLANTRQRRDALAEAVEAARSAAEMARQRYTAGLVSYQTVLDTERSVLSIEDSLEMAEAQGSTAVIQLYKALGGGWDQASAGATDSDSTSEES